MVLLSAYMFYRLTMLIVAAIVLGILTLPAFFLILWLSDRVFVDRIDDRMVPREGRPHHVPRAAAPPTHIADVPRASSSLWCVPDLRRAHMIGGDTEKEANFKPSSPQTLIPSQMPAGYYTEFRASASRVAAGDAPVNGDKDIMSWAFVPARPTR